MPRTRVIAGQALEPLAKVKMTGTNLAATLGVDTGTSPPALPARLWDYQTGDFSQWREIHVNRSQQVAIVSTPARTGYPDTARFIVAPGDHTFGQTEEERGEASSYPIDCDNPTSGMEQWYAWSSYFPVGFGLDPENVFLCYTQWHHSGLTGVPNIGLMVERNTNPGMLLTVRGGTLSGSTPSFNQTWSLGTLPKGEWLDHKVYIKWSTDSAVGRMQVWVNGVERFALTAMANLYVGQTAYLKQGIYRGNSARTHTIYHTATRRGLSEMSVAL